MRNSILLFFLLVIIGLASGPTSAVEKNKTIKQKTIVQKDTVKKNKNQTLSQEISQDTIKKVAYLKLKFYKKDAHASYYADKFNGKRTASGARFDNSKYTAAHRKFPFGTKLKVTNQTNGKSVVVEVADRGPFSRGREIDLTKKAFREIAQNKASGTMMVTIEEVVK
jgi:rare lipoprotein A